MAACRARRVTGLSTPFQSQRAVSTGIERPPRPAEGDDASPISVPGPSWSIRQNLNGLTRSSGTAASRGSRRRSFSRSQIPTRWDSTARALVERLARVPGYTPYFAESFGSPEVILERVAAALADYVRTLRSGNSAYDRWRYAGDASRMSVSAQRGSDVFFFKGRCATCHAGFNFSDGRYSNLGVGWDGAAGRFADEGRAAVTGRPG